MCYCGEPWTFAAGHFVLGYFSGKASSKYLKVNTNLPLLFAASILPDVDLFLRFLHHRGPSHSLITITVLMVPFFLVYRKAAFPYFAALLSHSLIGDFFTGGVELLWPISTNWYGALNIDMMSLTNVSIEFVLFIVFLAVMLKTGLQSFLQPHTNNMILLLPWLAVLGPMLSIQCEFGFSISLLLYVSPSLFYSALFSYSMIIEFRNNSR